MAERINYTPDVCSIYELLQSNDIPIIKITDIEGNCHVLPDMSNLDNPDIGNNVIDKSRIASENIEKVATETISIEKEENADQSNLQTFAPKYKIENWILALIGCLFSFSTITLVPYHNVIELPEYWYEIMFVVSFGYHSVRDYYYLLCCSSLMDFPDLLKPKKLISVCLSTVVTAILIYLLSYLIWTVYLGYNSPMPFIVYIASYLSWIHLIIRIWFQFPKYLRQDTVFRNRLKSYYYYLLCDFTVSLQFVVIQALFSILSQELQWMIAIIFAWTREMNRYIQHRFVGKAAGANAIMAKEVVNMQIGIRFTSVVVILIGSKANKLTSYCCLGIDFALNIIQCLKIIRMDRKVTPNNIENEYIEREKEGMLSDLILSEATEFITPASFMIAFAIAYHGPNAAIIGGVKNELWHHKKVDDMLLYLDGAFQMTMVDLMSAIISFVLLKTFCNINAFGKCIEVMKKYGVRTIIYVTFIMNAVGI